MKTSRVVSISPVRASPDVEPQAQHEPGQSAVSFREVLRLLGGVTARRGTADAVEFTQGSEALMRRVLARYGFERPPATYAELFALFEYCDCLDAASGVGMRPSDQLGEWQAASFIVWRRKSPHLMPAIELYCAGDFAALRALHRQEDTLTVLGRSYREPRE